MIKIDKNIPIPPNQHTGGTAAKYPLQQMNVGDSFFIEEEKTKIWSSVSQFGRRNNKKFIVRKEGSGVRVWRVI